LRHLVTAIAAGAMCVLATAASVAIAGCEIAGHPGSAAGSRVRTTADHSVIANRSAANPRRSYYLSLGDSLARGVQPDVAGASLPTAAGYPDRLYAVLRRATPSLRLVKLGCSGETSYTMIRGGICHYPAGSQLAQAERFLRAHRGHVSVVTIDIGANDPNSCFLGTPLGKVAPCMSSRVRMTVDDLAVIMSGLRAAGGPRLPIIGMDYYVPELAGWLDGKGGKEIAVLTERLVDGYNSLLTREYERYGGRVANVFGAFHSGDFADRVRLPRIGTVPRNVATICQLTWACAAAGDGPNEHPNDIGYAIIALAFLLADQR
jgi:GDSL-like Lipase/Acylhydrolase family